MDIETIKSKFLEELDKGVVKKGKNKKKKVKKSSKEAEAPSFKTILEMKTIVFDNPDRLALKRERKLAGGGRGGGGKRNRGLEDAEEYFNKKKLKTKDEIEAELKSARYDVLKLASSAGEKLTSNDGKLLDPEELLAIQLGAKPIKKGPSINYKDLIEIRKKEKAEKATLEEFQSTHYKPPKPQRARKSNKKGTTTNNAIVKIKGKSYIGKTQDNKINNNYNNKGQSKGKDKEVGGTGRKKKINGNNKTKLHNFKKPSSQRSRPRR